METKQHRTYILYHFLHEIIKFHPIDNHRGGCDISVNWTRQDSNLPHSACKADALPDELLARKMAEAKGAAPSVLFRARQFSKLL